MQLFVNPLVSKAPVLALMFVGMYVIFTFHENTLSSSRPIWNAVPSCCGCLSSCVCGMKLILCLFLPSAAILATQDSVVIKVKVVTRMLSANTHNHIMITMAIGIGVAVT